MDHYQVTKPVRTCLGSNMSQLKDSAQLWKSEKTLCVKELHILAIEITHGA